MCAAHWLTTVPSVGFQTYLDKAVRYDYDGSAVTHLDILHSYIPHTAAVEYSYTKVINHAGEGHQVPLTVPSRGDNVCINTHITDAQQWSRSRK